MNFFLTLYRDLTGTIADWAGNWLLPLGARFTFAAVLLVYYWSSALTKFSDGFFGFLQPSFGAYYQILPKIAEAAQFDPDMISAVWYPLVLAGSWAEIILPLLIVIGLFTRGAALAMIGFIFVQSLTDIFGHNVDAASIGGWFDRASDALILDQRLFWVFLLLFLAVNGAGRLSLDHWLNIDKSPK
jgi:putative oxidoreductase